MKSTLTHSVQSRLTNWYLLAAAIALLNLIGIPRVMKTFFSLALEPHRYIVLVFLAKCFFLTSIFLLASCSFSFHWLLVSGDLHVIDRLCLSNVLPSNLKIVLCIAGAINMDNCLIVIGRCFFMIPDDGLSHMKHYVAKKWLDHSRIWGNFANIWQGNVLIQKSAWHFPFQIDWE